MDSVQERIPSFSEVSCSIAAVQREVGPVGRSKLLGELKNRNPHWQLSIDRLKKIQRRMLTIPDCILIYAADPSCPSPLLSRETLSSRLTAIHSGSESHIVDMESICRTIGLTDCSCVASFYSRQEGNSSWYYQVYGAVGGITSTSLTREQHFLIDLINPSAGKTLIRGTPLLIVKNGPQGGTWEREGRTIDIQDVLTTLWYYHKSGREPSAVYGEREFRRFLMNLV